MMMMMKMKKKKIFMVEIIGNDHYTFSLNTLHANILT